jgi:hypothetical protein
MVAIFFPGLDRRPQVFQNGLSGFLQVLYFEQPGLVLGPDCVGSIAGWVGLVGQNNTQCLPCFLLVARPCPSSQAQFILALADNSVCNGADAANSDSPILACLVGLMWVFMPVMCKLCMGTFPENTGDLFPPLVMWLDCWPVLADFDQEGHVNGIPETPLDELLLFIVTASQPGGYQRSVVRIKE